MPIELIYLIVLLAVICLVFIVLKRPIYEAMFVGYIAMIACLGAWGDFGTFLLKISTNTLFYAIIAFLTVAHIFSTTGVIDDCIDVILSIFGRFTGGAGYVALIGSTFMGALSGSGAGNVAATGVFTIPAMKKSGFPPELAANVEMSASTMGNMIPPAGVITAAFAALGLVYPDTYDMSQLWMVMWGISAWFILQRAITLFAQVGLDPLLACGMLPVITGAMEGMTPPLALCMYTAMGIAGSDLKKTTYNCLIWVGLHYAVSVICLMGILPIIGL